MDEHEKAEAESSLKKRIKKRIEELKVENEQTRLDMHIKSDEHWSNGYEIAKEEDRKQIKEIKELLIEYGGHQPGCSARYDKKYPCRCGWDRERKQVLKE